MTARGWISAWAGTACAAGLAAAGLLLGACGGGGGGQKTTADRAALTRPAVTAAQGAPSGGAATTATPAPARQTTTPAPAATQTAAKPAEVSGAAAREEGARRAADRQSWRPAWWIASPVRAGGKVKVAAMADDADLLTARRKAVDMGLADLRVEVKADADKRLDASTTIDVITLPDGRYRAFVLVEGAP